MPLNLSITADWERLNEGTPEERACFAAVTIRGNDQSLTEGHDGFVKSIRSGPYVSAYHLAEWMTWNWWRLRWEPRSNASDWPFAHCLASIGEGYVWPNVTIFSDGERTALIAKPTEARAATAFRYISASAVILPSMVFEHEVDRFVVQVLGQLHNEKVHGTNLELLREELMSERCDRVTSRRRKLEALLGQEPDTVDPAMIDGLIRDSEELGDRAVEELAADHAQGGGMVTAADLDQIAATNGFSASLRDMVRPTPGSFPSMHAVPAWKLGSEAARLLREQNGLGNGLISNEVLASLAGIEVRALNDGQKGPKLSFSLDGSQGESRIVLRSSWPTGRRFDLARLLADRIILASQDRLHAATRAYTYCQKMQRSFAAEFLCPFDSLNEMLDGDYSEEAQSDAARYFQVSDLTIRTLLVNHHRVVREELDEDFAPAA